MFFSSKVAPGVGEDSVVRARFHKKTPTKKRNVRSGVESPALREGWSTWRDASATRGCNWLRQNALARLHAAKPKSCCHAPGKRDCSWMLLNDAKRIVTAARKVVFEHSASLVICGIANGIVPAARREEKNWCAEATNQVEGRQLRIEGDQRRSIPDKSLLRKEIAERRGTRSGSTKQLATHSSIHPRIPQFIRLSTH